MQEILTPTIRLKIVAQTDCESLHLLRTNAEVAKFIIRDTNQNVDDISRFIDRVTSDPGQILFYKIEIIATGELAGAICLKNIDKQKKYAEVGYELFPKFQARGLMTIALEKIIDLAFTNLGLKEIEAFTNKRNLNSRKLLEKFNFEEVVGKTDRNNANNIIYSLSHHIRPSIKQ